jgi:hypothetical protein
MSKILNKFRKSSLALGKLDSLIQDCEAYNFDKIQRLYLLNSTEGPDKINIIGGTSSASLFFTSANKLDYVNIQFGDDYAFDDFFQPLYKRDIEFQKFIYGLRVSNPDFSKYFPGVSDYLDLSRKKLSKEKQTKIDNITKVDFENQFALLKLQETL